MAAARVPAEVLVDLGSLRRYVGRFRGCLDQAHSEQVLGCYRLAAEQMHR